MNIVELYQQIPVGRHGDIKVVGDRVLVKGIDGSIEEYLNSDGELWLVRAEVALQQDIKAIRSKLGI